MIFKQLVRMLRQHLDKVSWPALGALLIVHAIVTWMLLAIFSETDLVVWENYIYYYIVTTSTVGYGDLSPQSVNGKIVVAAFQIPFGLALFGAILGKMGQTIGQTLRKNMTGEKDFSHFDQHIIIFGWHPVRTKKMIDHILGDTKREQRQILLAVTDDILHPFPDNTNVDFAKLPSFTEAKELKRIGINTASRIIIDGKDDDQTFTTGLRIAKLVDDTCHVSAFFTDETKLEMLREHSSNIECISSKTAEILVRSMQDPGASRVQEEMLSTLYGDTQFSLEVPKNVSDETRFKSLFVYFKDNHNATIIALAENRIGQGMDLNPKNDIMVKAGQVIHYLAEERVLEREVNWQSI